jgi:hypothetical protein
MKLVLSIDPSGNYVDGHGHTGLVLAQVSEAGWEVVMKETIKAADYDSRLDYWRAHIPLLDQGLDLIVMEDFMLYPFVKQGFSYMETPRLLGILELSADTFGIPIVFQRAADMAHLKEDVLIERGILEKRKNRYWHKGKIYNDHERSALKHFIVWYEKETK